MHSNSRVKHYFCSTNKFSKNELQAFYLQRCTMQIPKNINNDIPLAWNFTAKFIRECLARDMASRESMHSWKNVLATLTVI